MQQLLQWKSSIIYSECVCRLNYPACNAPGRIILLSVACLALQYSFTLRYKWHDIRKKSF